MPMIKIPARETLCKGKEREVPVPPPSRTRNVSRQQSLHEPYFMAGPSHSQAHPPYGDEPPVAGLSRIRYIHRPLKHSSPDVDEGTYLSPIRGGSNSGSATAERFVEDVDRPVEEAVDQPQVPHANQVKVPRSLTNLPQHSFRAFIELDEKDPWHKDRYPLLPIYCSKLTFEKVIPRVRKKQTLSVWQDEQCVRRGGKKRQMKRRDSQRGAGRKGGAVETKVVGVSGENVEWRKRKERPPPLDLTSASPTPRRDVFVVQDGVPPKRVTRSMTGRRIGGDTVAVGKGEKGEVAKTKPRPSLSPLEFHKCTVGFDSFPPSLAHTLPFTTEKDLVDFLQSKSFDEVEAKIDSIRIAHIKSFSLRHAHIPQPHIPNPEFKTHPPLPVAKINAQRLRYRNLCRLLNAFEDAEYMPMAVTDWYFLRDELYHTAEEVQKLVPQWYEILNKYVGEYDELVTWLRLQIPFDTSKMKTRSEVKGKLMHQRKWIEEKRRSDIARAIDVFCNLADMQYDRIKEMEDEQRNESLSKKRRWEEVEAENCAVVEVAVDDGHKEAHPRKRKRMAK